MVALWGGGVRQQYPLLSVSPSDSCFALLFVFPQVNAVFLNVSSSSSEYTEIVVRIENVIRIMAPLFCVLFFPLVGESSQQQQGYWSCLKRDFASLYIPNNHKIGFC